MAANGENSGGKGRQIPGGKQPDEKCDQPPAQDVTEAKKTTPGRMRVLLAGGLESNWTPHMRALENAGIQHDFLDINVSPAEIAEYAQRDNTVVVIDLSADQERGMEAVSACRKLAGQSPLVVMTADSSVELARRIRRAGVFYIAVHPVNPAEMLEILHNAFRYLEQKRSSASMCKTKQKILVIDDDADFLKSVTALLETEGYSVSSARSGKQGLPKIASVQPDLIILDIMMEHVTTGYEINQAVKFGNEFASVKNIPILMVSSIQIDPARRFSMAGEMEMVTPNAYLTKPLDIHQFLAKIRELLGEP